MADITIILLQKTSHYVPKLANLGLFRQMVVPEDEEKAFLDIPACSCTPGCKGAMQLCAAAVM